MVSYDQFKQQLYRVFSREQAIDTVSLEQILNTIPTLGQFQPVPEGTIVLVRVDLDMPIRNGKVEDLSRIKAYSPTIKYCIEQGWKIVIFGHLGRDKSISVMPV